jgi:hypothetical protein
METEPPAPTSPPKPSKEWTHTVTASELKKLAALHMNGRQIKNVLKGAQLLSFKKKERLSYKHLEAVLEGTQAFYQDAMESKRANENIFH